MKPMKHNHWKHALLAGGILGLLACSPSGKNATESMQSLVHPVADSPTLLIVNGEPISEALVARMAQIRGLDMQDPAEREQAQSLLVESLLLAQEMTKNGALARPEVQIDLDLARIQSLASRNLSEARAGMDMSDEQLRAFYDQVTAQTGTQELHLRHALYTDEALAQAGLQTALASNDFTQWLEEATASGAQQARDLGWANATQLPPEVAQIAFSLNDGAIATSLVQSRFGWHVLQRVASRPFTPPPFEQVREGIRKQAGDKFLEDKLAALRNSATIQPVTR